MQGDRNVSLAIEKYLPKQYEGQLQLEKAVVGTINKKQAHRAMQGLKPLPTELENAPHLKKIRKQDEPSENVDILLCLER
jgi:hypothetical protein